jgi:hypothetical protein
VNPRSRIPIEYRLAIGASCTHDEFDGSAILSLCHRDPWVGEDRGGNLVNLTVHDGIGPVFTPRVGASETTPQELFRTGFGSRLTWDVTITVGTSRIGFIPPNPVGRPEVNDGSLWHLASLIGLTAGSADIDPLLASSLPPYLYLTTNYQHYLEQWIPVEIDPNAATLGPIEFDPQTKTAKRSFHARFASKRNYKKILPAYFPSFFVDEIEGTTVTDLPALQPGLGGFTTQVTLSRPLPASLGLLDGLLLNLGNSAYGWKLFTVASLDNSERTILTLTTLNDMSGEFLIPPSAPIAMRSAVQSDQVYLPTYCLVPF